MDYLSESQELWSYNFLPDSDSPWGMRHFPLFLPCGEGLQNHLVIYLGNTEIMFCFLNDLLWVPPKLKHTRVAKLAANDFGGLWISSCATALF